MARVISACLILAALTACTTKYERQVESHRLMRPTEYPDEADLRALEPYRATGLFRESPEP